jgi:5-methylcytosine-specific restriction endonuclease McrA
MTAVIAFDWRSQTVRPKACASCSADLPVPRPKRQKWCPPCSAREQEEAGRERMRKRYHADPERSRAERAAYRERNRLKLRAYQREYAKRKPEKLRDWRAAHPDKMREMNRRARARRDPDIDHAYFSARRARKRGAFVERVFRSVLWRRHGGFCGICREVVALRDMHVDHVRPLARGGEHSYANTQPAHPQCNRRKGASLP